MTTARMVASVSLKISQLSQTRLCHCEGEARGNLRPAKGLARLWRVNLFAGNDGCRPIAQTSIAQVSPSHSDSQCGAIVSTREQHTEGPGTIVIDSPRVRCQWHDASHAIRPWHVFGRRSQS